MTEAPTNTTGDTQSPDTPNDEGSGLPAAFTAPQIENILTLDAIMSSARRARRTARICLAGDLEDEYLAVLEKLGDLVDREGKLLEEESLAGAEEAQELRDRAADLQKRMAEETYKVVFEGMVDEEWEVFEKANRDKQGNIKDLADYNTKLIVACAVEPKLTVDDVAAMRKRLRATQMTELANTAYGACATGGVDVPKLPSFWHAPRLEESSLS